MRTSITERRLERLRYAMRRRQKNLTLVMDNIHDPHNVAAVLRSCDAFGIPKVHLYYTTEAYPALGRRSSASARKWVDRKRHDDAQAMVAELKAQGMTILSSGFSDKAKPLFDWDLTQPTAVVLSNEHGGTKPELKSLVDGEIYIPMMGMVQSLNVSVAAAVILYEAFRQRNAKGLYDSPSFSPEELQALEADWVSR